MALKLLTAFLGLLQAGDALGTARSIRELRKQISSPHEIQRRDVDPSLLYPTRHMSVPVDHFHNESAYEPHENGTFDMRYWFDASYYKPGGPVIVLQSGETDATERLPYLQKGILHQLAQVTNGIGVVLEHRYYGESWPTADLSTENLRFLTTDQALADQVYFAKHVVFEGLENSTLTAPTAPYIAYGGSYAGAFVAFLRKLYPDVYFGSISSSGVTEAIYDYWEYYEAQRIYGPADCISTTQKLTNVVDNIIIGKANSTYPQELKDAFGLGDLTYNDDFASTIAQGVGSWQSRNWDPAVTDDEFFAFCGNITSDSVLYPATASLRSTVQELLTVGGYGDQVSNLTNRMLNYVGYVNVTEVADCVGESQDECFGSHNATFYEQDDISQTWRSWPYQYCTQWGFLQTGSGVPADQLPLISRTLNLEWNSIICRDAFNITEPSDVEAINKHGGYNISYPRLAIIDGQADPWRQSTPHAFVAPNRTSTSSEPFILIEGAVHHWDENGLFPNQTTSTLPPAPVADTQKEELQFVQEWMAEWKLQCGATGTCSK